VTPPWAEQKTPMGFYVDSTHSLSQTTRREQAGVQSSSLLVNGVEGLVPEIWSHLSSERRIEEKQTAW